MTPPQLPAKRKDESLGFDPKAPEQLLQRGLTVLNSGGLALSKRPEVLWRFHGYGAHPGSEQYRPPTLPVIPENIPQELRERDQWVAWDWVWDEGGWRKQPIDPSTGEVGTTYQMATWSSMPSALALAGRMQLPGVGYVFTDDDPYIGIDLDDCRDLATGRLDRAAAEIVALLDSYTELSVSGTGVHIIARGLIPERRGWSLAGKQRRSATELPPSGHTATAWPEIYHSNQFFVMTGDPFWARGQGIAERQAELERLHASLPPASVKPRAEQEDLPSMHLHVTATSAMGIIVSTWDGLIRCLTPHNGLDRWQTWIGNLTPGIPAVGDLVMRRDQSLEVVSSKPDSILLSLDTGRLVPSPNRYEEPRRREPEAAEDSRQHEDTASEAPADQMRQWTIEEPHTVLEYWPEAQLLIAANEEDELFAIDLRTGRQRWRMRDIQADVSWSWLEDGILLIHPIWDQQLYAIEAETGAVLWIRQTRPDPLIADSTVYLGKERGGVQAVDLRTGLERWSLSREDLFPTMATDESVFSPLIRDLDLTGNILIVATNHTLTALRLPDL